MNRMGEIDRMIDMGEIRSFSDLDIVLMESGISTKDWTTRDEVEESRWADDGGAIFTE
jgi:hypothetical protein